ncbi:hypothetical protein DFA_02780 [Cavenderia fasciculata]|uniref:Uncharacterized protein n=1 Tax=Cavenderia fasciculata TaxID=261658 RepID=F4PIA3_CACFS|nr:uncharacterized protein DFA_02780 [Cavenderia fasciculata]EGG24537.1 hypothetical protein DFA_02780 [Cavenderia fasciculata]|eukprot:XP_004362388.1 hypothetical protein DFA_02780 [Cavenderia fasciculata]
MNELIKFQKEQVERTIKQKRKKIFKMFYIIINFILSLFGASPIGNNSNNSNNNNNNNNNGNGSVVQKQQLQQSQDNNGNNQLNIEILNNSVQQQPTIIQNSSNNNNKTSSYYFSEKVVIGDTKAIETEKRLLSNPSELSKDPIPLSYPPTSTSSTSLNQEGQQQLSGMVLLSLEDLPLNTLYITPAGQQLIRINDSTVKYADGELFEIGSSSKRAPDLTSTSSTDNNAIQIEEQKKLAEEEEKKRNAEEVERKRLVAEQEKKRLADEQEKKRLADEAEKKRLADEKKKLADEQEKKKLADEAEKRLADEAEKKRLADEQEKEEIEKKRLADEAEKKRLADEQEKKRLADEAEKKRLADEQEKARLAAEEAERKRLADESERQKEAERKRLAEEAEKKRLADEQEKVRLAAEETERKRLAEEAEKKRLADEQEKKRLEAEEAERKRLADEAEKTRLAAEEAERKRLAEESERQRLEAEEAERKRLADEAEKKRLADEAEKKRLAEEEAERKRLADEAEKKRLADEQEKTRLAAEESERKRLADEAEKKRLADEQEKKRLADEAEKKKRLADEAEKKKQSAEDSAEKKKTIEKRNREQEGDDDQRDHKRLVHLTLERPNKKGRKKPLKRLSQHPAVKEVVSYSKAGNDDDESATSTSTSTTSSSSSSPVRLPGMGMPLPGLNPTGGHPPVANKYGGVAMMPAGFDLGAVKLKKQAGASPSQSPQKPAAEQPTEQVDFRSSIVWLEKVKEEKEEYTNRFEMRIGANRIKLPSPPPSPILSHNNNPDQPQEQEQDNNTTQTAVAAAAVVSSTTELASSPTSSSSSSVATISTLELVNVDVSDSQQTTTMSQHKSVPVSSVQPSKSSPNIIASSQHQHTASSPSLKGVATIGASTSRSSNALVHQKKVGGPNEIYQLLAEQKLTETDIWGGHPDIFPVFCQYNLDNMNVGGGGGIQSGSSTMSLSSAAAHLNGGGGGNNSGEGGHVLSVNFPTDMKSEFGEVRKRSYKIAKKLTVAQTVNLICRRQQIKEPRRFWLSTIMGCIMNDDILLSTYGFGTFFKSWELNLVPKQRYLDQIETDSPSLATGDFVVDFTLPPLTQFGGLKKKRIKVDSNLSIFNILEKICNKYKVEEPERFSLITNEEFPLVLNLDATLSHYGLGSKISTMELSIVFNEFIPPYSIRNKYIPSHGVFQVGNINPKQQKAVIVDLENKLFESMILNEEMVSNIKQISSDAREKESQLTSQINQMEVSHNAVMSTIVEQLTKFKETFMREKEKYNREISYLTDERNTLTETLDRLGEKMRQDADEFEKTLFKEKSEHQETSLRLNHALEQQRQENKRLEIAIKEQEESHLEEMEQKQLEMTESRDYYESKISSLMTSHRQQSEQKEREKTEMRHYYETRLGDIDQQRQEEEKRLNDIYNSSLTSADVISSAVSPDTLHFEHIETHMSQENSEEMEKLRLTIERMSMEIKERDVIIKTVYPKKIDALEKKVKLLEQRYSDAELLAAQRALEIEQKTGQLEQLRAVELKQRQTIDTTTTQLREEERRHRAVQNDLTNTLAELEAERSNVARQKKQLEELEQAKLQQEIQFKQKEANYLYEIEELKKPKPPPMPTYKIDKPKPLNGNGKTSETEIRDVRTGLKAVVHQTIQREPTIAGVADLLFISLQKRFASMNQTDIEDLDDDDDDEFEFD